MTIKAKFRCSEITDSRFGISDHFTQRRVKFNAVYGTEGENRDYSKATPSGQLEMQIDKDTPAYDAFVPGDEYYLTFNKV